jgi:hypothetical protein
MPHGGPFSGIAPFMEGVHAVRETCAIGAQVLRPSHPFNARHPLKKVRRLSESDVRLPWRHFLIRLLTREDEAFFVDPEAGGQ